MEPQLNAKKTHGIITVQYIFLGFIYKSSKW